MLTPGLESPVDVVHKMERELRRAFHHRNYVHKTDHLFNFCVTAHSMREMVFQHLKITEKSKKDAMHKEWSENDSLKAAMEIANSAKHFTLRDRLETKAVERTRSKVINIRVSVEGEMKEIPEEVPDLQIVLADCSTIGLGEFLLGVTEFWKQYLQDRDIDCPLQDEATYFGDNEDAEPMPSILS